MLVRVPNCIQGKYHKGTNYLRVRKLGIYFFFPPLLRDLLIKKSKDARLIEGTYTRDAIIDITPLGRDYLDHVRNDTVWGKTKKNLQPLGTVPLSVVSQVTASCISSLLGL